MSWHPRQNAYRTGHFTAAYATLLITDPVVGVAIGALLLGEGAPRTLPAQIGALVFACLAVAGNIALAQARHRNPEVVAAFADALIAFRGEQKASPASQAVGRVNPVSGAERRRH